MTNFRGELNRYVNFSPLPLMASLAVSLGLEGFGVVVACIAVFLAFSMVCHFDMGCSLFFLKDRIVTVVACQSFISVQCA